MNSEASLAFVRKNGVVAFLSVVTLIAAACSGDEKNADQGSSGGTGRTGATDAGAGAGTSSVPASGAGGIGRGGSGGSITAGASSFSGSASGGRSSGGALAAGSPSDDGGGLGAGATDAGRANDAGGPSVGGLAVLGGSDGSGGSAGVYTGIQSNGGMNLGGIAGSVGEGGDLAGTAGSAGIHDGGMSSAGTCGGADQCLLANGKSCSSATSCASGECWDGVCCATNCGDTHICQACNLEGSVGTCSTVTSGEDADTCFGAKRECTAAGACGSKDGATCDPIDKGGDCASGKCVDGYCCNSACTGVCRSCNVAGKTGTCSNVLPGDHDNGCSDSTDACDGSGGCGFIDGLPCSSDGGCASGNCVDSVCCKSTCQSCDSSGQCP